MATSDLGHVTVPIGRKKAIDPVKLVQLIREGHTRRQCAEYFNVTMDAVKHAESRIKKSIATVPKVQEVSDEGHGLDAMKQLTSINGMILTELDRCHALISREEAKIAISDTLVGELEKNPQDQNLRAQVDKLLKDNFKGVLAAQNNVINMSGEIRKQIELQLKIAETLYSIQMMQEFQSEMITLLKEVDPFVAQKFKAKLVERRQLRGLVKMTS
jgi:hypothetical protein